MVDQRSAVRAPLRGDHGAVSAGHPLEAEAGSSVLQSGGNVVDAVLAMSGVACVVEPAWCGLGGDAFLLFHRAEGGTVVLNGSGAAPRALTDDAIGASAVPRTGPLSISVPGLAGAWQAAMPYASRPLADLLEPAIAYARDGFAVYPRLARAIAALEGASDVSAGLADLLAGNGRTEGEILRQADLVRSLADVAADPSVMYDGALADAIVAGLQGRGARLGTADLAEHRTEWVAPLRARYRGYEVATHPPVSLGCVLLEELRILEGFDLASFAPGQPELIPLEVAAAAAAAEDADRYLGDPAGVAEALAAILSDDRAAWWRERLADERHESRAAVATGSDTTSIVAADSAGNVACLLQSLFNEWGSRELVAGTGVLLNDRLANLRVGGDHHNRLRPGQRPLHTLHAYLVLSEDRFAIAGATPGGRGQAQTNLQVLVNMLDLGDDVQTAIDRPRWLRGLPRRGEDRTVYLEAGSASAVGERLREAGHPVEDAPRGALEAFGNCTVVARDAVTGQILAGADRRRGAHAMAW